MTNRSAFAGWYHGWNIVAVCVLAGIAASALPINAFSLFLHDWSMQLHTPISTLQLGIGSCGLGCALLVGLAVWQAPARMATTASAPVAASFGQVQAIVKERCSLCHNAQLDNKGIRLDAPDQILAHAPQVYQQVVVLKAMPLNNATQITETERGVLKRWYEAGAHPD